MTDEQKLKLKFADAWLRNPNNAYAAALSITKNNSFLAVRICDHWLFDDEVAAFKDALIEEHGEDHFLPSKYQMVHDVYTRATNSHSDDSFAKLMKLAADMRGFIEKQNVNISTTNVTTNNRVMLIPVGKLTENGTVDADYWEQGAIAQQNVLTQQ